MSVLSSLLARDQVVPVKKIEEAIQRQVISGGELPTVLLEVGASGENVIAAYHAAALGLSPASRDDVMNAGPETVNLLSRALAEAHQVVAIAVEANTLVVATASPLSDAAVDALSQGTGRRIVARIVTEPRIAAAMQAHYQITPIPRMRRLVTKLATQDPGEVTNVAPILENRYERQSSAPPTVSGRPNATSSWMRSSTAGEAAEAGAGGAAGADRATAANVRSNAAVRSGNAAESKPAVKASSVVTVGVAKVVGVGTATKPSAAAPAEPATENTRSSSYGHGRNSTVASEPAEASGEAESPSADPIASSEQPETELLETTTLPANRPDFVDAPAAPVTIERELTAEEAIAELAKAESRAAIIAIAFAHVRTHFEYTAIFSARDEEAEGLDAHGEGATPDEVRAITIDLERPGTVRDVRQLLGAKAGVLDSTEADRDLVQRLARTAKQPSVIVPVAIRQRLVLLVYGDRGGKALGIGDLGDLMSFLPRVHDALQRLILERKRGSGRSVPAAAREWGKSGAAIDSALGRDSSPPADEGRESTPTEAAPAGGDAPQPASASSEDTSSKTDRPSSDRPREFDLLRVPRKAPLPPDVTGDRPGASLEARPEPAGSAEVSSAHVPSARRPSVLPGKPVESTTYRGTGGEEEVVLTRKKRRSSRPAAPAQPLESDRPEGPPTDPTPGPDDPASIPAVKIPAAAPIPAEARRSETEDSDDDGPNIELQEGAALPDSASDATIITDIGLDLDDLIDELIAAPRDLLDRKIADLVGYGEPALRVLTRRFPGPLTIGQRPGPEGPHPKARDASPVIAAMIAYRHLAVPHVVTLLDHRDAEVRYFATLLAGEVMHRDLVVRIGRRVLDDDAAVRAVAVAALRAAKRFEGEVAEVLAHFRRVGGNDRAPSTLRRLAVELLGELRDGDAVSVLADVLSEDDADLQRTAHKALVRITKQDLGVSSAAWETWVSRSGNGHRVEWLIDALTSDDDTLRREAGEELKNLTKEYFGFQSALPRKELEVVQRKYRKWWENIGRSRFVRA